jgi:hypothetical protein
MPVPAGIRNQRRLPRLSQRDRELLLGRAALALPRGVAVAATAAFVVVAAFGFFATVADASDGFSLFFSGE